MKRKKLTVNMNAALHRLLKIESAVRGRDMRDLLEDALSAYLRAQAAGTPEAQGRKT